MGRVGKGICGIVILAGLGMIVANVMSPESGLPAWLGWLVGALGCVVMFVAAAKGSLRKFDEAEWIPAHGIVTGLASAGDSGRDALRLQLSCDAHGHFRAVVLMNDAQLSRRDLHVRGLPVEATVMSNNKRIVEVVAVNGEAWSAVAAR